MKWLFFGAVVGCCLGMSFLLGGSLEVVCREDQEFPKYVRRLFVRCGAGNRVAEANIVQLIAGFFITHGKVK